MTTAFGIERSPESETIAAAVVAAAQAAATLLPASAVLVAGDPIGDPEALHLPQEAAAAVTARLTGEVSGDVVLVLSAEVVEPCNAGILHKTVATAIRHSRIALDAWVFGAIIG